MTRTAFPNLLQTLIVVLVITTTAHAGTGYGPKCNYAPLSDVSPIWGEEQIIASRISGEVGVAVDVTVWNEGALSVSHDDGYAFVISCDGWVRKVDLATGKQVGHARAGLNSNDIEISTDGKWLAVANNLPNSLVILSTDDLSVGIVQEVFGDDDMPSRITAIHSSPLNESFILSLTDVPKIWEVFYGSNPPAVGFVHDWRVEGPPPQSNRFPIRKITIPDIMGDFIFDPSFEYIISTSFINDSRMVIDLVIGHRVTDFDMLSIPELRDN